MEHQQRRHRHAESNSTKPLLLLRLKNSNFQQSLPKSLSMIADFAVKNSKRASVIYRGECRARLKNQYQQSAFLNRAFRNALLF